jgi:hypothetical protein
MPANPLAEITQVYLAAQQAVDAWQGLTKPCPDLDPAMQHLQALLQRFQAQARATKRPAATGGPDGP